MFNNIADAYSKFAHEMIAQAIEIEEKNKSAEATRRDAAKAKPGETPTEFHARIAAADAALEKVRREKAQLKNSLPGLVDNVTSKFRAQLAAEIDAKFAANPNDIDANVLTLLDSGILRPGEYVRLFDTAKTPTMKRLIAHAAGEAAKAAADDREAAAILRGVANNGANYNGRRFVTAFDGLADLVKRTINNTAMSPHFEGLVAEYLKVFSS